MKKTIQSNTREAEASENRLWLSSPSVASRGRPLLRFSPPFLSRDQPGFTSKTKLESFATEAALFSVIVMTAAVSLISSVAGMVHLVRAFAV